MYRAIIVDDQPGFRQIIRVLLENAGGFEVVGEASDGEDAVSLYERTSPDLVMMDVQMERVNGFDATMRLIEHDPAAAVVITSMSQDPEYALLASKAGAIAFLGKRALDIERVRAALEDWRDEHPAAA